MTEPDHVLCMGDTHGNSGWARYVIGLLPKLLPDEPVRTILHAGDLGIWPGRAGEHFLDSVEEKLAEVRGRLLFVDGNHEWHPYLRALSRMRPVGKPSMIRVRPRIQWLERGYRWSWHGRTWLALGGAVSVDAAVRTEGKDWWPEEVISAGEALAVIADGHADVMLTHDAPTEVRMTFARPPRFWADVDLAKSEVHRELLQHVVNKVDPWLLIHGHYHRPIRQQLVEGGRRIIGLDMDGQDENYTVLDTRTLEEVR